MLRAVARWLVLAAATVLTAGAADARGAELAMQKVPELDRNTEWRQVVAVLGDSIVESGHLAAPERDGLLAALRARLEARGIDPGAQGFVAAHTTALAEGASATPGPTPIAYAGAWSFLTEPDGLSPLPSITTDQAALATFRGAGDVLGVLYETGALQGRFAVRTPAEGREVDAFGSNRGAAMTWLSLDEPGIVEIGRPALGELRLVGVFDRALPRRGRRQVELSAFSRAGQRGGDPVAPVERAGLAALQPHATLILLGTNDALALGLLRDAGGPRRLVAGLRARGRLARRTGPCAMVPPVRGALPEGTAEAIHRAVARAARETGCRYAPVLGRAWRPDETLDGIHPLAAGYARMAARLEPVLLTLLEASCRRPGPGRTYPAATGACGG